MLALAPARFVGRLAFDRASVRRYDRDGRLHVSTANLSKANVCDYKGEEIPGYSDLGLDPGRVYRLLRPADELERAASSFNNLPILSRHVPVNALDHHPELVVGSTGTDAEFDGTYLRNSLVIWSADAISAIESGRQRELSCGYRYKPILEPGKFEGERFDGRMTDIEGNHIATVADGRAGADVVIGDSAPRRRMLRTGEFYAPGVRRITIGDGNGVTNYSTT
jgi:uncharacterized protein